MGLFTGWFLALKSPSASTYISFTSEGSVDVSTTICDSLFGITAPKSVSTVSSCLVPQEIYRVSVSGNVSESNAELSAHHRGSRKRICATGNKQRCEREVMTT